MDTIRALGRMPDIPQWFVYRLTWDEEANKFQKVPCYPDGSKYRMDASDRDNWQTFSNAQNIVARLRSLNDGYAYTLGFWLTANTGYWFFDLDACLVDGKLTPLAQQLTADFTGCAWEWSSSGRGLHLFGSGHVPEHRRKDIHSANLEFYTDARGIAFGLSGIFHGDINTDHTASVAWLVANYFPAAALPGEVMDSEFDRPCAAWSGPTDDNELIARIRRSERLDAGAVFAGVPSSHATFSDLFDGNRAALDRCYPGASDADYALIGILSFWTGRDAIRTERIMRMSALYREKWESNRGKDTYIRYSILRQFRVAHAENRDVYGQRRNGTSSEQSTVHASSVRDVVPATDASAATSSLITVTTADPSRKACLEQHRSAFNASKDSTELETAAAIARADPRMADDIAYSLADDLFRRFEEIQVRKRIQWCRAALLPDRAVVVSGQHRESTEFGNVQRMLDRYGRGIMFVDETEQWYQWDNIRWNAISPRAVEWLAQETIMAIYDEARAEENEETRAQLIGWARDSQKHNMVKNMVNGARSQPHIFARSSTLDTNPTLLGAQNGMIDLTTGSLLAPDINARITQYTRVDYDPAADCPWFKQTVREAFFDNIEMVTFFKRLMGYTLMGNPKEAVIVIPYGHGSNGKSTIMGAIANVLGDYARTASAETFTSTDGPARSSGGGPREDLVRLRGARFLRINEVDENAHLREAVVKSLTGDDVVIARGVQARASVEYKPRFVPVMPVNHRPIIKGDDNGIWRRIMMVPFERNFKTDPNIPEDLDRPARIAAEAVGILTWLVQGAIEYQQFGLRPPAVVGMAHKEYREDMDVLGEWIATYLEFDEAYAVSSNDLYMSWQQYAMPKGLLRFVGTQTALSRKLTGRDGFRKDQRKNGLTGRCWVGVRLRTPAEVRFGTALS